jgi:hypothetical protein
MRIPECALDALAQQLIDELHREAIQARIGRQARLTRRNRRRTAAKVSHTSVPGSTPAGAMVARTRNVTQPSTTRPPRRQP